MMASIVMQVPTVRVSVLSDVMGCLVGGSTQAGEPLRKPMAMVPEVVVTTAMTVPVVRMAAMMVPVPPMAVVAAMMVMAMTVVDLVVSNPSCGTHYR